MTEQERHQHLVEVREAHLHKTGGEALMTLTMFKMVFTKRSIPEVQSSILTGGGTISF